MRSLKILNWSSSFRFESKNNADEQKPSTGYVYILSKKEKKIKDNLIENWAPDWQVQELMDQDKPILHFITSFGAVFIIQEKDAAKKNAATQAMSESAYVIMRDSAGVFLQQCKSLQLKEIKIYPGQITPAHFEAFVLGLDMATYSFKSAGLAEPFKDLPAVKIEFLNAGFKKAFDQAQIKARAVNRARHLVNLPPNECNPQTIEDMLKKSLPTSLKMEVWDEKRLKKENMNLLLAVGAGSEHGPRLIRLRYRPTGSKNKKVIAFVGKGITFDTGGLDIKPSSAMRLMKKDMGGSASICALALFAAESKISQPCDFYLSLAENSVDGKSFRPSDVYVSRSGISVEIDNTDAEGRLVLADALDVAASEQGAHEPQLIVDVATLTGACRVALGAEVAGLFSNDDELAQKLFAAGHEVGDYSWQLPLVDRYFSSYNSPFADLKNSGESFGGAILAALFLQKFVKNTKWAHLDAYCWTDKTSGVYSAAGGSGQTVQMLMNYLLNLK